MMTVEDLIEELENYPDNAEVRLALQPHYPMEHYIGRVVSVEEPDGKSVVYIAETTGGNGYLPGAVAEELGW